MLNKGMAVLIRNEDELEAFAREADKKGYDFLHYNIRKQRTPIRISCNIDRPDFNCLSRCEDLYYPLNKGITKVVEASDLFRNQLISIRRAK